MIFLFDLDGTIIDSKEGIINSFVYAFEKFGYNEYKKEDLNNYIGPTLKHTYTNKYKFNEEDSNLLIEYFREYYSKKGKFESSVFRGIKEVLDTMYGSVSLGVATSKPQKEAVDSLKYFDLYKYFDVVSGAPLYDISNSKVGIIESALEKLKNKNNEEVYMLGDRYTDIEAASMLNIKSLFALWGYATKDEIENLKSNYRFKDPLELKDFAIKNIIGK